MHSAGAMLPLPARYRFLSLASTTQYPDQRTQVSFPLVDHAAWQPERRLMLAVLEEAVNTLIENGRRQDSRARRLYLEAAAWVAADDEESPFGFVTICDTLRLDSGRMRQWIFARIEGSCSDGPTALPESRAGAQRRAQREDACYRDRTRAWQVGRRVHRGVVRGADGEDADQLGGLRAGGQVPA